MKLRAVNSFILFAISLAVLFLLLIKPSFALENNSRGLINDFPDNSLAGVPYSDDNVGEGLIPAMTGDNIYEDYEKVIYLLNLVNIEDTTPPAVSSVSPADGATDVPINRDRITVRFNEDMDRQSLLGGAIYFTDSLGNKMPVNFRIWFDDGLQLQFYYLLEENSTYYVHVTTDAQDLSGNHLAEEFVSSFTTIDLPPDNEPPAVSSVSPADGATDVPINRDRITVRFNEDMDRQSLLGGAIYFTDSLGNKMPVNFRIWFDDGLQLQFYYLLEENSTYYVHVTTDAQDLSGNHLAEEFVSSFTTIDLPPDNEPPAVSSVSPADGATDVPINRDRITVRFNEDMDRQSLLGGAIYFTDSLGNKMPVNFRIWFDDGLQLQFYYLLEENSTYYVHVTTDAQDLSGNHLAEEFVSSFTTESLNQAPVADANGPYTGNVGSSITFDASGSHDPDGVIVLYEWDFENDGVYDVSSTSPTATHAFSLPFSGFVSLRVTDEDGLSDTDTASVEITNQPPVADANGPYTGNVGSSITFDASGSHDPDGVIVLYEWDFENDGVYDVSSTSPMATHAYGAPFIGLVGLRITDNNGLSDTDTASVEITNQAPVALCKDVTQPTGTGVCSASASVNDGSYDPDGDEINLEQTPAGPYELGDTEVTLTVTDNKGASDTCGARVTVQDQEAPVISSVTANPSKLWPPNRNMVPVTVVVISSDNCDPNPVCQIASVGSNEPINGTGGGDTDPDWVITGELTAELRAERSGNGDGRVYSITVSCSDETFGNTSTRDVTVNVPHDKGKKK